MVVQETVVVDVVEQVILLLSVLHKVLLVVMRVAVV